MKRNIIIGGAAKAPEETGQASTSTGEQKPAEAILNPGTPAKRTESVRRNFLTLIPMLALSVGALSADNRVTLIVSVKSAGEIITTNNLARAAAGEIPVDNQLEVETAK